jgi:urease accessory protein
MDGAMAVANTDRIFAGNRAVGRIALIVESRGGITRRTRIHEAGSLRVRFPGSKPSNSRSHGLEATIVNTAGGMAGGDCFDLEFSLGPGARLTVTSIAAEKVYRSLGPDATIRAKLRVGAGAYIAWLPQETILFDRARLARMIDLELAEDACLLFAEAAVFGRSGMGEALEEGRLVDRWRVRRGGRLLFAETMRLDGPIAKKLAQPAVANGGVALATVLMVPGGQAAADAVRAIAGGFRGEVGASAWNGLAVARLCAADGAALRHDLLAVLTLLAGGPLPRVWLN